MVIPFNRFPDIPFCFKLERRPLCQTLLNALDMSRKTPLVSRPSSSDWYIPRVIHNSCLMHESPGLNPDWLWRLVHFQKKNRGFSYKLSVLVFYHKQVATRLHDSFQLAVFIYFIFFMNWDNISFFNSMGNFPLSRLSHRRYFTCEYWSCQNHELYLD